MSLAEKFDDRSFGTNQAHLQAVSFRALAMIESSTGLIRTWHIKSIAEPTERAHAILFFLRGFIHTFDQVQTIVPL